MALFVFTIFLSLLCLLLQQEYHPYQRDSSSTINELLQSLKKLSQCLVILESLTWHKSNKLANILRIIYTIF